ncbi:DUF4333 domain-containing protein [Mycolicibacterium sp. Dal123E01]|uniref:DUF4333 domain-containing protein n=1 Tax=Mycolicibacterium sp. Dal123E01 TaxID=3457578 RepID=UPI00403EC6FE
MGDTDRDPTSDTPPSSAAPTPAADVDPERTVVVPGRAAPAPPAGDPDSTGDYRVGEETTTVVPRRAPGADSDETQLAGRPTAAPSQPAQWASSPMTPPPPAATPGPVPQGGTQHWPQSPMTPPPGAPAAGAAAPWPPGPAGAPYPSAAYPGASAPQYPPFPPGARPAGRSRRTLLIAGGAGVAVLAVVLITGLWVPGYFNTDTLDVQAANAGVQQVLTDPATGYGLPKVSDVACNHGQNPTITDGGTFTCAVTIGGSQRQVSVRFVGKDGTYAVGRPE